MLIVSRSGDGDTRTIQEAVDRAHEGDEILVRKGTYRERVIITKKGIRLRGESAQDCRIVWNCAARDLNAQGIEKTTFLTYALLVTGEDITVESLTIENDAGDGRAVGQAVAVYAAGDRSRYLHCRFVACQDTLYIGPTMRVMLEDARPYEIPEGIQKVGDLPEIHGRAYFEDCCIVGDVDFIFGPWTAWFERCRLHMNARGGWYTAADTPKEYPFGFIFHECHLSGDCDDGLAFLGRPWRGYAQTYFLACRMDACVNPIGFTDWDEIRVVTDRLGEGGTSGAREDLTPRHPRSRRLSSGEMAEITRDRVLEGWNL
ncbi:MAG: pectin methylesterase [Clostridia bacterium]|nr:pectin methylesterase [Clostridia bacterium]